MYIINDICYAGTPSDDARVAWVKPLVGGMFLLEFTSGERKLFDTTTLTGSTFKPLENPDVFKTARVEHGFVCWADGSIDIAPEYLYENGIPYEEDCTLAG